MPKTLEEQREIVKQYVREKQMTHPNAHMMYFHIAFSQYGWEDVASSFLSDYTREKIDQGT